MDQFGLIGKFTTAVEDRDAFIEILSDAANIMKDVDACKQYLVYKDVENDEQVWVSEIWESEEAHAASLTREDVRATIARAIPLLKGVPNSGIRLKPVAGKGM